MNKAFDAYARGSKVVMPPRNNRRVMRVYEGGYNGGIWHLVENFFCKPKDFKNIDELWEDGRLFYNNIYPLSKNQIKVVWWFIE